jgi:multiple sugar transport system substrate-binding protein
MKQRIATLAMASLLSAGAALPVSAQSVTLRYAAHYTDEEMVPLTACFRDYEKQNPGTTIQYQQVALADFLPALQTSRLAGTLPDILNVYSNLGGELVANNVLAEPPADVLDMLKERFEPTTVEASRVDGKIWGIPAEVSLYMLVYNKKLFSEAGVTAPPTDWNGVLETAKKIAKQDELGRVTTAGYAFGPTVANATHPLRALMFSQGLQLVDPDATTTNLTDPRAVAIVDGEAKLFADKSTSPANKWQDFSSGQVGMFIGANWLKKDLRDGLGDAFEETVGVAPIPGGADWKTYQYAFYQSVAAESPNGEAAWKLLRWLNEPRGEGKRSCVGDMLVRLGSLSANKSDIAASTAEYSDPFTKPYVDALASGRAVTTTNLRQTTAIDQVLRTEIEEAWLGRKTGADAMAAADARISAILAEP